MLELKKESKAVRKMERNYLTLRRNVIYTTFEDVEDAEWFWSAQEIEKFDQLWRINMKLERIAEEMRRSKSSVALLGLDRMMQGKVPARDWIIW
ncbi:hypothetical protein ACUXCC_002007 [Cytobacillus horneckiae]|uniref:hypothetical protein n=1 Tax=Cytobacillus horneckiae TaxID=549687 RepID=UPI0019D2D29F|nr:hypothetical protein [Cytobacillus horneckiae]MBN6887000.1 hypothetical protein [Cytobacillus horneckiae]